MFSLVSPSSLENAKNKWLPEIRHHSPGTPALLVGTKLDLRGMEDFQSISTEEGMRVAKQMEVPYMECSALKNRGLKDVFDAAVRVVIAPPKKQVVVENQKKCCEIL